MAIVFPIVFPTIRGVASLTWRAVRSDAKSESQFSFAQQVIQNQGQKWLADLTLPPMDRAEASEFIGFLLALDGRAGSFLFTPPDADTPRGILGGTPVVAGAGQVGSTLNIDGGTFSTANYLRRGDYFQLWTGAKSRLHMITQDAATDGTGAASLEIWPKLRESPTDNMAITTASPAGVFALESAVASWSVDDVSTYGITFGIEEKL